MAVFVDPHVEENLSRLLSFGLSLLDSDHGSLFLPVGFPDTTNFSLSLELFIRVGSDGVVLHQHSIGSIEGPIPWVVREREHIHVTPFRDSENSFGLSHLVDPLAALLALPINIHDSLRRLTTGVLAMTRLHGKLPYSQRDLSMLHSLATSLSEIIRLSLVTSGETQQDTGLLTFMKRSVRLIGAMGPEGVELIRLYPAPLQIKECVLGIRRAVEQFYQAVRLIEQMLPPHFPLLLLPSGGIVVLVDRMMSSFFQRKIEEVIASSAGKVYGTATLITCVPDRNFIRGDPNPEQVVEYLLDMSVESFGERHEAMRNPG